MLSIILLGLGLIAILFGVIFCKDNYKSAKKTMVIVGIFIILLGFIIGCVTIIPSNTVGVKWSMFNGTSENTLNEGVAFKFPLDKIYKIDTTVQERTDENISVQTKDAQWVKIEVNVKYQVSKENAFKVYKGYKTLENLNKNIIGNYAQDSLNEVCSEYNVIDILGEKRNEIVLKTTEILKQKYLNEGVDLKSLTIKDIDAGEAIEKAIQDEAVAKKNLDTAIQNKEIAKTEAETKLIEAEGQAKANEVKTKQLTDKILAEQWIEKWNGVLPTVSGDDGIMIDISKLLGGK